MKLYCKIHRLSRFFAAFLALLLTLSLSPLWGFASEEGQAVLPPDPDILANGALLVDLKTGKMVYGKNEHEELYPASLTKIMTALLTLEAIDNGKLGFQREITAGPIVNTLPADGISRQSSRFRTVMTSPSFSPTVLPSAGRVFTTGPAVISR